jgi:class 3 adenylate cyclase
MAEERYDATILIADITGSVQLYERDGDTAALHLVEPCLFGLRETVDYHGGKFIRSKGDDVLGMFEDAGSGLRAAREMLSRRMSEQLDIHIGLNFGHIIRSQGDVYGDAVNLTARVAALARPGEVLATSNFVDQLSEHDRQQLRVLDKIVFKGKSSPTEIYALLDDDVVKRTAVSFVPTSGNARTLHRVGVPEVTVSLRYGDSSKACVDLQSVSIGRSAECDIVIDEPWVSRNHLSLTVRQGKVQLTDESSSGTYVVIREGYDFFMRRETVLLTDSGIISPGLRPDDAGAKVVDYEILRK